jgi:hypothetical protein
MSKSRIRSFLVAFRAELIDSTLFNVYTPNLEKGQYSTDHYSTGISMSHCNAASFICFNSSGEFLNSTSVLEQAAVKLDFAAF